MASSSVLSVEDIGGAEGSAETGAAPPRRERASRSEVDSLVEDSMGSPGGQDSEGWSAMAVVSKPR
ncbi:hypothetical protein AB0I24_08415 [Brachybacterium paraconglomeratum]